MLVYSKVRIHSHRGVAFWHNVALISFLAIAITLTATVMNAGFNSGESTKRVLLEALKESRNGLEIMGKIAGTADVSSDKVKVTATPIRPATGGTVVMSPQWVKISYKLVKIDSHTITYDNILVGLLNEGNYNSFNEALIAAKQKGLIDVNPNTDTEKPTATTAFIYWILNINDDESVDDGEIAAIAIVYADQDRPSTSEYILVHVITPEGSVLTMERTIPHLSNPIIDLGGKVDHNP